MSNSQKYSNIIQIDSFSKFKQLRCLNTSSVAMRSCPMGGGDPRKDFSCYTVLALVTPPIKFGTAASNVKQTSSQTYICALAIL